MMAKEGNNSHDHGISGGKPTWDLIDAKDREQAHAKRAQYAESGTSFMDLRNLIRDFIEQCDIHRTERADRSANEGAVECREYADLDMPPYGRVFEEIWNHVAECCPGASLGIVQDAIQDLLKTKIVRLSPLKVSNQTYMVYLFGAANDPSSLAPVSVPGEIASRRGARYVRGGLSGIVVVDPVDHSGAGPALAGAPAMTEDNPPKLQHESDKRQFSWDGRPFEINQHAEYRVLRELHRADGAIVSYGNLLRAIDATRVSKAVKYLTAPAEVKEAAAAIRRAFKEASCPHRVKAVRGMGYQLLQPNE